VVTNYEAHIQRDNKQQMKIRGSGQKTKQEKENIHINLFKSKVKKKQNVLVVITNPVIDIFNALYSSLSQ
jgi:hypothetical protein